MNINLNNYEAFFLDYHEGKLAPQQVAELMSFLEEHPELKEMFYEFENISLAEMDDMVHDVEFEGKNDLKKEVRITRDEINDLLAGAVEGVLDNEQQEMLEELLNEDPKTKQDLEQYRKTIITADLSEVFEGKEKLKRSVLITRENYTEYLSAAVDNELNTLEQMELERFMRIDPSIQQELELFRKTRLVPDLSIVYENKEALKRRKRGGVIWYIPAAAAGVALIIGLFFMFNKPTGTNPVVAGNNDLHPAKEHIKSFIEEVKKEVVPAIAATEATHEKPRKAHRAIVIPAPGKPQQQPVITPVQEDLRDLQSPMIAGNPVTPEDSVIAEQNMASNSHQVNERIDPEDYPEFRRPVATGYNSLRDLAIGRLKTSLMKEEAEVNTEATKISKWDIVSLALRSFRKVTGKSTEMRKVYDEEGEVIAYNINMGGLQFSRNK